MVRILSVLSRETDLAENNATDTIIVMCYVDHHHKPPVIEQGEHVNIKKGRIKPPGKQESREDKRMHG